MMLQINIRDVFMLVFTIFCFLMLTIFFMALYSMSGTLESQEKLLETMLSPSCHVPYRYRRRQWPPSPSYGCTLGDQPGFRYLINRDICGSEDVYMLVVVGSHPDHVKMRKVIRHTWGNPRIIGFPFRIVFIFGHMDNPNQQSQVEKESLTYRDIIQGNFKDSYHNVTIRDLMGLRWAWQYCSQAKFIMKADDDISVDIYGLIDALEERFGHAPDFVGCFQMMVNTTVWRTGRYQLSKKEHLSNIYDPYCQGWMYILTPHMAYSLDRTALKVKPYWMNDAYLTGSLVKALGKMPVDLHLNHALDIYNMSMTQTLDAKLQPKYTIGPTGQNVQLTFVLHQKYKYYAKLNGLPKHRWNKNR